MKCIFFIFVLLVPIIFFKCSSSSLNIVELKPNLQKDTEIDIMPFSAARKRLERKGSRWRGMFTDIIDKKDALYKAFDDEDLTNIRQTLIKSLRKSQNFKAIYNINTEKELVKGVRLYICFDRSGIKQTSFESFCFLNACVWTEIAGDSIVSKKDIKTVGKSIWSLSNAKNKAITKFIKEVALLLSG